METAQTATQPAGGHTAADGRTAVARPLSGAQWTIAAAGHEAVIAEIGGGLREYRVDGVDCVDGYDQDEVAPGSAGQVLAPWPNRIRDGSYSFGGRQHQLSLTEPDRHNAIHGLVNWQPWHVVSRSDAELTVETEVSAQPGYPWPLLVRAHWSVGPEGLEARHEAVNLSAEPCPFGFAPHPYLVLPGVAVDDLVMHVPARTRLLVDSRLLPIGAAKVAGTEFDFGTPRRIGATVLDTAFGDVQRDADGRSTVTLAGPAGLPAVAMWADAAFGWWQVFTGDALPADRRRRSVAVEPMTCPPDAFRSGRDLVVLEPGQTWSGAWGIRPSAAPA
jgi:aldose 1-epimerase